MRETEIKGQAFRTYLEVVRETWGNTVEQRLIASLTEEFREALKRGLLLSSGWYPVAWYRQYYEVLPTLVPNDRHLAFRIGEATTKKDLVGMYSFILQLTSPGLVARHLHRVIGSFMRGGEATMEVAPGTVVGNMQGWHGVNRSLWEDFCGGGKPILEATGARNVTAEVTELSPGTAQFRYQWAR
jgi:hypothetical protein